MDKDKPLKQILKSVSEENNISAKELELMVDSIYKFIKETIPPHKVDTLSLDELRELKTNFNIPTLCKFYISEKAFKKLNNII